MRSPVSVDSSLKVTPSASPASLARDFKAPEFVTPTGKWQTRDGLLSDFWQWRGSTIAMLSDPARDTRLYAAKHPVWGMLDATGWGLFLATHLERHLEQIAETRSRDLVI